MEFIKNLAIEQRSRLIGSIMGYAERRVYRHLPDDVKAEFREKVLQAVGQYHDFILDCLKASVNTGTESVVNEEAIRLLRDVHQRMKVL